MARACVHVARLDERHSAVKPDLATPLEILRGIHGERGVLGVAGFREVPGVRVDMAHDVVEPLFSPVPLAGGTRTGARRQLSLHTRDYREFCLRVAGRFIEHVPTTGLPAGEPVLALRRTVAAMRQAGYVVDDVLWTLAADCTGCHGGCHDDPPPGA